ncbi:MAG TPA: ammonium transporter [Methylococcus sp.]|nr:ammonium transporter [Methylococcus sp.]
MAEAHAVEVNAADTAWILTSTGLVLFMTMPGLALLYSGLVRTKNVLSVMVQVFAVTSLVSLLWVMAGYSLALTGGGVIQPWLGGTARLFLRGLNAEAVSGNLPEVVYCMYHLTFAIFAPALMIGSCVERMKFSTTLWFTGCWTLLVYVPVCHWMWGEGWLAERGAMDFAGGVVVHTAAGTSALVAAWSLGPRRGYPRTLMPPHNLTLTAVGAGILAVGWHGFSAGSALMATGAAGMAMLATHIGASVGALVWMTVEWWRFGKPTMLGVLTGMIAGLGVISPAAGFVGPFGALVMGAVSGVVCFFAIHGIKRKLGIDDTMDVFPVHGVGGMVGTVLTAPFATEAWGGAGIPTGLGVWQQTGVQILAVVVVASWSGLVSLLLLRLLNRLLGLRVSPDQETEGLDVALHNGKAYHL